MVEVIKQSIEARKNAIFSSYNVEDKKMLDKIDNLFKKINDFGEKFTDVNEFEKEFANSSLNNDYINIFVELSKVGAPGIGETILESAANEVVSAVMPSRAVIADKRDQALRDIPVVGDIMQAGQTIDFFNKFRKKK